MGMFGGLGYYGNDSAICNKKILKTIVFTNPVSVSQIYRFPYVTLPWQMQKLGCRKGDNRLHLSRCWLMTHASARSCATLFLAGPRHQPT